MKSIILLEIQSPGVSDIISNWIQKTFNVNQFWGYAFQVLGLILIAWLIIAVLSRFIGDLLAAGVKKIALLILKFAWFLFLLVLAILMVIPRLILNIKPIWRFKYHKKRG